MTIEMVLFEPEDVLYTYPNPNANLQAYLESIDIKPRHPAVVEKALKAARFDAYHGRITRDAYYDAILRFHGVEIDSQFDPGRDALYEDAAAIDTTDEVLDGLETLQSSGLKLGIAMNSEHTSQEIIKLLTQVGFAADLWNAVVVSRELELIIPEPDFFERVIASSQTSANKIAFVTARADILPVVVQQDFIGVAFRPTELPPMIEYQAQSFTELISVLQSL